MYQQEKRKKEAIEMFEMNLKYFKDKSEGFNILSYSTDYYNKNRNKYSEPDRAEIGVYITILEELGYIEHIEGQPFGFVKLTEKWLK